MHSENLVEKGYLKKQAQSRIAISARWVKLTLTRQRRKEKTSSFKTFYNRLSLCVLCVSVLINLLSLMQLSHVDNRAGRRCWAAERRRRDDDASPRCNPGGKTENPE